MILPLHPVVIIPYNITQFHIFTHIWAMVNLGLPAVWPNCVAQEFRPQPQLRIHRQTRQAHQIREGRFNGVQAFESTLFYAKKFEICDTEELGIIEILHSSRASTLREKFVPC